MVEDKEAQTMTTAAQQTKQLSFSQAEYSNKKKLTRRELFLSKMESVVPWVRLIAVIDPYYPKSGRRGRPPIGLARMLRMYLGKHRFIRSECQRN